MKLLDGKALSDQIKAEIKEECKLWIEQGNRPPHLAAVLVGNNPASLSYVSNKVKSCEEVGFQSTLITLSEDISEGELLQVINNLNLDKNIDGYIVQLPLPLQINESKVLQAIHPDKDVDGFHPVNIGKMVLNLPCYLPATPKGILTILDRYQIETSGKHCVVLGRSNIVGKPISILLGANTNPGNCTVTLCHSRSTHLKEMLLSADIVIAAIGKPLFITKEMLKPDAVVIDVGINRIEDSERKSGYRLVGDVDFAGVSENCSAITPVPGGVGPMTVCSLIQNTFIAAKSKTL